MIKFNIFLLALVTVLSGCSAQPKYFFIANLENTCSHPIRVNAVDYSNAKKAFIPDQEIASGGNVEVLSQISFSEQMEISIPDTYRLDIKANEQTISLDKQLFIAQLKNSPSTHTGKSGTTWTISDSSLCPQQHAQG
ncbi:hypothetical protein [Halopseudomonas sabulinigri]|uniref:Lipoprotein n=1 Tax=Halopseudomonas sabulinigri TaxID=472181 RepID=A0A1H1LUK5_9GAMM|nr:hypothetical protein [Halopseudomonas sabulinigri]SDR78040.1 hypothetical protein SAMN05216271_0369 [Halopseudomonas sabulinigri]